MTAPTHTAEVKRIARGLTAAQRELLMEDDRCVRAYRPAQKLIALELWYDEGNEHTIKPRLTPLGIAVRHYLQEQG